MTQLNYDTLDEEQGQLKNQYNKTLKQLNVL
jgi:hypothetical protein